MISKTINDVLATIRSAGEEEAFMLIASTLSLHGRTYNDLSPTLQLGLDSLFKAVIPPPSCALCHDSSKVRFRYFNNRDKARSTLQPRFQCSADHSGAVDNNTNCTNKEQSNCHCSGVLDDAASRPSAKRRKPKSKDARCHDQIELETTGSTNDKPSKSKSSHKSFRLKPDVYTALLENNGGLVHLLQRAIANNKPILRRQISKTKAKINARTASTNHNGDNAVHPPPSTRLEYAGIVYYGRHPTAIASRAKSYRCVGYPQHHLLRDDASSERFNGSAAAQQMSRYAHVVPASVYMAATVAAPPGPLKIQPPPPRALGAAAYISAAPAASISTTAPAADLAVVDSRKVPQKLACDVHRPQQLDTLYQNHHYPNGFNAPVAITRVFDPVATVAPRHMRTQVADIDNKGTVSGYSASPVAEIQSFSSSASPDTKNRSSGEPLSTSDSDSGGGGAEEATTTILDKDGAYDTGLDHGNGQREGQLASEVTSQVKVTCTITSKHGHKLEDIFEGSVNGSERQGSPMELTSGAERIGTRTAAAAGKYVYNGSDDEVNAILASSQELGSLVNLLDPTADAVMDTFFDGLDEMEEHGGDVDAMTGMDVYSGADFMTAEDMQFVASLWAS